MKHHIVSVLLTAAGLLAGGEAPSWPAWRGPHGDGSGVDCGRPLVEDAAAIRLLWTSEDAIPGTYEGDARSGGNRLEGRVPGGYSSPVVAGGRVYLFYHVPNGPVWSDAVMAKAVPKGGFGREHWYTDSDDVIHCFDAATGKTLFRRVFTENGYNYESGFNKGGGQFTMCVARGKAYALGAGGKVYAVDAATGEPVWESDVGLRQFYTEHLQSAWRRARTLGGGRNDFAGCVIVSGGTLAVSDHQEYKGGPRDSNGNGLVGFDADTGRRLWYVAGAGGGGMLAATPMPWRSGGKDWFVASGRNGIQLIDAATGTVAWTSAEASFNNGGALSGDLLITAGGPGIGGACWKLTTAGMTKVWALGADQGFGDTAPAVQRGRVYFEAKAGLQCADLATGKILGVLPAAGVSSSLVAADGRLIRQANGRAKAGFNLYRADGKGAFEQLGATCDVPYANSVTAAIVDGKAFIRGRDHMHCYDLTAK